jgi:hypothetical protein
MAMMLYLPMFKGRFSAPLNRSMSMMKTGMA